MSPGRLVGGCHPRPIDISGILSPAVMIAVCILSGISLTERLSVGSGGRAVVTMADEQVVKWRAPIGVVAEWAGSRGLIGRPVTEDEPAAVWCDASPVFREFQRAVSSR